MNNNFGTDLRKLKASRVVKEKYTSYTHKAKEREGRKTVQPSNPSDVHPNNSQNHLVRPFQPGDMFRSRHRVPASSL